MMRWCDIEYLLYSILMRTPPYARGKISPPIGFTISCGAKLCCPLAGGGGWVSDKPW